VLRKVERYASGEGWARLPWADKWLPLYARLHVLSDGALVYAGSFNTHYSFPFIISLPFRLSKRFPLWGFPTAILDTARRAWHRIGQPRRSQREEGATMLLPLIPPDYPSRVLLMGGGEPLGTTATSTCEIIDLPRPRPTWHHVPSLA